MQHIGYIGLGIMGSAMAANLIDAGHRLTLWNRTASKADPLVKKGGTLVGSPREVATAGPDVVCLNVTDTADVEAVLFADDTGLVHAATDGLIVVDHSTISPVATRRFAHRLAARGVTLLDAPVSGGDTGAKAGTLSIMVGGPADAVERVRPMLDVVGSRVTHVGQEPGMGQACKACNQVAVVNALIGTCEAIALARASGLDVAKMIEVVSGGAGGSWQLANLGPKIDAGDDTPGFLIDYLLKDLGIVADTARTLKLPLQATALAETLFRAASAAGDGERGTQAVMAVLDRLGQK